MVLGAGLAGLTAARELSNGGADVVVSRGPQPPGGRVEQTTLADGRLVQLGGEVVAPFHTAHTELVGQLGLTLVPAFPDLPGGDTWLLADGRHVGDDHPWFDDADRRTYEKVEQAFTELTKTVDPDDPWSHPRARELDDEGVLVEEMVGAFGDEAAATLQAVFLRRWGIDPWTRGYITSWRPGDVMAVGPLHGSHEPPFYVCGSDQWVCGYMEGAVRTGRGAGRAALTAG